MFHRYFFPMLACAVLMFSTGLIVCAQSGELRGHVIMKNANGTTTRVAEAAIDVFRVDISGKYETKTNKKGEFMFAGIPYTGTYIVAASQAGAQSNFVPNVKAGRDVDFEIELFPSGNGKRLTLDEIKAQMAGNVSSTGVGKPSAEDAAKRAEIIKENKEIAESNARNENINEIVGRTFKAGNEALRAKNYDEAIKHYQEGLVADPEQGALHLQIAEALRVRGVERFNTTIKSTDVDKTAGFDAAKQDFRQAADSSQKAVQLIQKEEARTDAAGLAAQNERKFNSLAARKESMRLFVTKVDPTQADTGLMAYNEYIAAEPDPVKKLKARMEVAQMLVDAGAGDKALAEYQKVLAEKPDDPDATLGAGLALYSTGEKAKYQDAANFLQQFVDKAPDSHKDKETIKAVLAELKNTENIVPEKIAPTRRRRP